MPKRAPRLSMAVVLTLALWLAAGAGPSQSATVPQHRIDPAIGAQLRAAGRATFWVDLAERADLSTAEAELDWNARGALVVDALTETAERSQAAIRALLSSRRAPFTAFWASNTILVSGDADLVAELAPRPEVARLRPARTYPVSPTQVGAPAGRVGTVEWGIDRIGANDVWADFGDRGEGIVVASIDTGVQYTHPALVKQYRGRTGADRYNHDYDWWDPMHICAGDLPCDNVGHGTHVTGTMVGDNGAGNQIGVAPRATWIAAKGCESTSCSDEALLSSAQWMLAPTRRDGTRPRPVLRPHVVNNSWGGAGGDPWFQDVVQDWVAAGIFPVFPLGSSGPACATAGSPGDYPESYAMGAFDVNDFIASFSSRGPSQFGGETKPDIAAPGVNIRSSWNNGGYQILTGTSMASPHVAGTVALVWAADPTLRRDIAATRAVLDASAIDTAGPCGGGASDNNTWGQGRLDAYAAVQLSARPTAGTGRAERR